MAGRRSIAEGSCVERRPAQGNSGRNAPLGMVAPLRHKHPAMASPTGALAGQKIAMMEMPG